MKKIDNFTKAELEQYYKVHSYVETCEHFNISGGILDRRLKAFGITRHQLYENRLAQYSSQILYEEYITKNCTKCEVCQHLGLPIYSLNKLLKKYHIIKETELIVQRRTQTKTSRYGNGLYNNRSKYKKTCEALYGGIGYGSKILAEKSRSTTKNRYGNENIVKTPYLKDKAKKTKKAKYGESNYNNASRRVQTCLKKYGVEYFTVSSKCRNSFKNNSRPNESFAKLLTANGIKFQREFPIANRCFDFKVENTLVDINPHATHNSTWGIRKGTVKDSFYHFNKAQLALSKGYRCIFVWDWDNISTIIKHLFPLKENTGEGFVPQIIPTEQAEFFLNTNCLQRKTATLPENSIPVGLCKGSTLVQLLVFIQTGLEEWELLECCTIVSFVPIHSFRIEFNYFVNRYKPKKIIGRSRNDRFSGKTYLNLGFTFLTSGKPELLVYDCINHCLADYNAVVNFENKQYVKIYSAGYSSYGWNQII